MRFEQLGGDTVAASERSRERAVVDRSASAGGAVCLEYRGFYIEKPREIKRRLGAFIKLRRHVHSGFGNDPVAQPLGRGARRGESAVALGAHGDELVLRHELSYRFIRQAVISAVVFAVHA